MSDPERRGPEDFYSQLDEIRRRMHNLPHVRAADESPAAANERAWREYLATNPELQTYLDDKPETDPSRLLILPHTPVLIGGMKSNKFIIPDAEQPDAAPDENRKIDLSAVALPASGLAAFGDLYTSTEQLADRQYEPALFEVRQMIADTEATGQQVDKLFIPDTVNHSAKEYFKRLARLAQDTGKRVVIRLYDKYASGYYYREFAPPEAESVDAYWQERTKQAQPFAPKHNQKEPPFYYSVDALDYVTPYPSYEQGWDAAHALINNLRIVADTSAARLKEWLSPGEWAHNKFEIIKELAYGKDRIEDEARAAARMILAKIGYAEGLQELQRELRKKTGMYGYESAHMEPHGEYLRQDPALRDEVVRRVRKLAGTKSSSGDFTHLLGALYATNDPRMADFLSSFMLIPEGAGNKYSRNVLGSTIRWMRDYIDILHDKLDGPEAADAQQALTVIEGRLEIFLNDILPGGRHAHLADQMMWVNGSGMVAEMLMRFKRPQHRELLGRAALDLFQKTGSVLGEAGAMDDNTFARFYGVYRKIHGDLPEISRLIWTPGRRA